MSIYSNCSSTDDSIDIHNRSDPRQLCVNKSDCCIDNLVDLALKSERCVIACLRERFEKDLYYTWAGRTLIAIRPYVNGESSNFILNDDYDANSPSIRAAISRVLFRLEHRIGDKANQSVMITGESGSGKTYSSSMALKYISRMKSDHSDKCVTEVLAKAWFAVPLLTAFGNAATSQNDDSSRYGQLFQLNVDDETNVIENACIKTFVLEKSRVSGPNRDEGNFHIFRQILKYETNEYLHSLYLSKSIEYKICNKRLDDIGERMSRLYEETLKAMENLNMSQYKTDIYKILAMILNLGNVRFCMWNDNFVVSVDSANHLENVSHLLETDVNLLRHIFTTRIVAVNKRSSMYKVYCATKTECENRRNALMKFLYEKLFIWIVRTVNESLRGESNGSKKHRYVGILDVYGFETLARNSFEQLCINYANEKLHWYFVDDYFRDEEYFDDTFKERYKAACDERIALFDEILFNVLDEVCYLMRKNGVDGVLMERLRVESDKEKLLTVASKSHNEFVVNHYAGPIKYDARGMVSKNTDKVPEEFAQFLCMKCNCSFLKTILQEYRMSLKTQTILTKYKKSLNKLLKVIGESDVQYIKCLKTNSFQVPNYLDECYFANQLRANGVLEILKLSFQGFTIKLPLNYWGQHFQNIICNISKDFSSSIQCGSKYIFLNEREYVMLEKLRNFIKFYAATKIAYCLRKRIAHRRILQMENKNFRNNKLTKTVTDNGKTIMSLFNRRLYFTKNIITYWKIPHFKIVFHTSKTCILNSHVLPRHLRSRGLADIL